MTRVGRKLAPTVNAEEARRPLTPEGHREKIRFLLVGAWNTVFSYGMLWVLDALLHARLHYALILTLNWVIGVTHNLFTFKLLVFRTKGNWLREYLRSYVVYAGSFALNLAIVAAAMEVWRPPLLLAQLPAIVVVTIVSYAGHKYFTYRTIETELGEVYEATPVPREVTPEGP